MGRSARVFTVAVAVAVVVGTAAAAPAATIDVFLDGAFGSTGNTGVTAEILFTFSEVGADDRLTLTLNNTTASAVGSALTAFGFEVPDLAGGPIRFAPGGASDYFDALDYNVNVAPGWLNAPGGYDVMLTSDRNYEGGSTKGAPRAGQSQTVTLSLGDTGLSPDALAAAFESLYSIQTDNYLIGRFQAVGPRGECSDKVGGRIPEPGTLALMALAAGLAVGRRGAGR